MGTPQITADAFLRLLLEGMPSGAAMPFDIVTLERGSCVIRLRTGPGDVRPGGTVAGPVLFGLADLAIYAAVLSAIGEVPPRGHVRCDDAPRAGPGRRRSSPAPGCSSEGRQLIVGEVEIDHEGEEGLPVAHAVMPYSVPAPDEPRARK